MAHRHQRRHRRERLDDVNVMGEPLRNDEVEEVSEGAPPNPDKPGLEFLEPNDGLKPVRKEQWIGIGEPVVFDKPEPKKHRSNPAAKKRGR